MAPTAGLYVPVGHSEQFTVPTVSAYPPAAHGEQEDRPLTPAAEPRGHAVHTAEDSAPVALDALPAEQGEQVVRRDALP